MIPRAWIASTRRTMLDAVAGLNEKIYRETADPETHARISQYEMAFRMQTSVPELADLSKEPKSTWDLYGEDARQPGSYAYNCLMARRLAERGVRFTQVYKRGWDLHENCVGLLPTLCKETDRATYALVTDLKQRGMLDDTLVIWGGEFGRTIYSQGGLSHEELRPRPPRQVLQHVAGRRRHQGRHCATARPTTSPTPSPKTRSTFATWPPRSSARSASTTSG